jgi:hypothetical protein
VLELQLGELIFPLAVSIVSHLPAGEERGIRGGQREGGREELVIFLQLPRDPSQVLEFFFRLLQRLRRRKRRRREGGSQRGGKGGRITELISISFILNAILLLFQSRNHDRQSIRVGVPSCLLLQEDLILQGESGKGQM